MRALILTAASTFEIRDVPVPELANDEALVAIRAVGICGSDVHGMDGSTGRRRPPLIMGHEAAGVVTRCGSAVSRFKPGDRVALDSTLWCGTCGPCRAGRVNLCEQRRVLGVSCAEYHQNGAFAEYLAVPERIVHSIPPSVTFPQAALIEALSIAVHAVSRANIQLGDSVAVFGCGMIGILCQQVARLSGAGRLIALDVDEGKLDLAIKHGADEVINTRSPEALEHLRAMTPRCVLEAVGVPATVRAALEGVVVGGTVVLVGNLSAEVFFPLQTVVTREIEVRGSCASSGEISACIALIASGRIQVDPFISAFAPLHEGPSWFARLHEGKDRLFKVVLDPSR